jgi:ATP-dependent Clp protease ATP-binding subunit ClpC
VIENALKKAFAPEFLNRIDDVVLFNSLTKEDINQIIDLELKKLFVRIEELGYTLELTKDAKIYLADKGYDQQFGARPLARAIQRYIEDPLAEEIINSKISEGDTIKIKLDKKADELKIDVVPGEMEKEAEK